MMQKANSGCSKKLVLVFIHSLLALLFTGSLLMALTNQKRFSVQARKKKGISQEKPAGQFNPGIGLHSHNRHFLKPGLDVMKSKKVNISCHKN